MSQTSNNAAATRAYQAHANDIAKLIDLFQQELDGHAKLATNWGRVDELASLRSQMMDMVESISHLERSVIEKFLAE